MATYYVKNGGSDAADGLSDANAWETIAKVNGETFSAGDAILFKRGSTWAENLAIDASGSSGSPITWDAYGSGYLPIIGTTGDAISANGFDWNTVQNIEVASWTNRGIWVQNGSNWIIDGCTVGGGNDSNPTHGIRLNATGANEINNIVRNCTIGTIGTTTNESINRVAILAQGQTDITIADNEIATTNIGAIWCGSSGIGNIVEGNHIHDCYGFGIECDAQAGMIMRYNHIHGFDGLGVGFPGGSQTDPEVYYNVIHDLGKAPINWNGIDVNNGALDGLIYNNTVYAVHRHCVVLDGASSGWTIKNNILDATANTATGEGGLEIQAAIGVRDSGLSFTSDNNILRAPAWAGGAEAVSNGSFETFTGTADDGTTDAFTGWTLTGADVSNKFEAVTTADAGISTIPAGTYALKFTYDSGARNFKQVTASLTSGKTYRISFDGISTGGGTNFWFFTGSTWLQNDNSWGGTNFDYTPFRVRSTDSVWTNFTTDITPTETGTYTLAMGGQVTGVVYIDNITVREVDNYVGTEGDGDGTSYNFADWQSTLSQDANSISADPLFRDVDDFSLQGTSPAISAGVDVGLTRDFEGKKVRGIPEIGAYEVRLADRNNFDSNVTRGFGRKRR